MPPLAKPVPIEELTIKVREFPVLYGASIVVFSTETSGSIKTIPNIRNRSKESSRNWKSDTPYFFPIDV